MLLYAENIMVGLRGAYLLLLAPMVSFTQATDPVQEVIAQFNRVNLVGLGERHGSREDSDFRLQVIRDPAFSKLANDVVIESGNPLYQGVLDRYVNGEDVPRSELVKIWEWTTQGSRGWRSPIYEDLITTVREVNRNLPAGRKLRVVAADYPADESYFRELRPVDRDAAAAKAIQTEVLDKKHKALVIFGGRHLSRTEEHRIPSILKNDPRASWFMVQSVGGPGLPTAIASHHATLSTPALIAVKGAVAQVYSGYLTMDPGVLWHPVDGPRIGGMCDAVLYFGSEEPRRVPAPKP